MTEDLRNTGANDLETFLNVRQTLETLTGYVSGIVLASEDPNWRSYVHRGATREGHFGGQIQVLVQSYLIGLRERGILHQGVISVGRNVELNFGTLELNRTSSPYDRTVGGGHWPLGPEVWFRNYQGILDQVTRLE